MQSSRGETRAERLEETTVRDSEDSESTDPGDQPSRNNRTEGSEILSDFLAVEEKWIWKHKRRSRFEGEKRGYIFNMFTQITGFSVNTLRQGGCPSALQSSVWESQLPNSPAL